MKSIGEPRQLMGAECMGIDCPSACPNLESALQAGVLSYAAPARAVHNSPPWRGRGMLCCRVSPTCRTQLWGGIRLNNRLCSLKTHR